MSASNPVDAGVDFFDIELWGTRVPQAEFAALRRFAPVHWITHTGKTNPFDDGGLWAVTKHEHIKAIARDSDAWSTNANGYLPTFPSVADRDAVEASKAMLVNHDPPAHTRLRQLVSRAFTPRSIAQLEDDLRRAARDIVTRAADKGEGDFVEDIAAWLPIYAISELIGIPEDDREQVLRWTNSLISGDDEDARYEDPETSSAQLFAYAYQMAEDRRRHPQDDIVTVLVNADIDGQSLTELEFGYFVLLLAVAGNETTRNATSMGMDAFFCHPDQWELFRQKRPATTADEIMRYTSPAIVTQRTARRDVELGGVTVREGQRVALFYGSANYDEEVFDRPESLDIQRSPNPHLGFGGNGPHVCLGASLARLELRVVFDAIADIIPDITKRGEPRRIKSSLVNGLSRLDARYR